MPTNYCKKVITNETRQVGAKELFKVYQNSAFVASGRGNWALDCFRLYEATIVGAIPVVVGPDEEILNLLNGQHSPPWIVVSNWQEAANKTKRLLDVPWRLDRMRRAL